MNDLIQELGTNFINYAMAVNSDRSIPDARTGLKPVARRVLWSAYKSGFTSSKPHVKSARLVGNTMGELHPHGDSSIYGALVRLSQDWVLRYPLIDWHGSNGNITGDGPAHSRYTECRLSKITEDGMLDGIKKENVSFIPNYDESTTEPETLPSIFPNLLCNPNTGIGVALATSFLTHNLGEVAQAIKDYVNNKEPMLYPDFPTAGLVINKKDIPNIMKTGRGSVKVRARYTIENNKLIFYEVPYSITIEKILTDIGAVCDKKEIENITDVRDETTKKGIRIVVECKKNTNLHNIASLLYSKTSLQTSLSYNQVALVNGTPTLLNLKDCIQIYLDHNLECLKKEANYDLQKTIKRLEIVNGLLKALEDIDNIIAVIKKSDNATIAQTNLITTYNFTESQAKAIVNMKLGSLANLEAIELNNEQKDLIDKTDYLNSFLNSSELQLEELLKRLDNLVIKYGDARRTELIDLAPPSKEELTKITIQPTPCVVIITENDTIKRVSLNTFKKSRRGAKGKKLESAIKTTITTNTIDYLLLFSSIGKMYRISVNDIPETATSLSNLIKLEPSENILAACAQQSDTVYSSVVFVTKKGIVKKTAFSEYTNVSSKGIWATKLKDDNDKLVSILLITDEKTDIMFVTHKGNILRTSLTHFRNMGRMTTGIIGIKLASEDYVISSFIYKDGYKLGVFNENGYGYLTTEIMSSQGRATKGHIYSHSPLADALLVKDSDTLLISGTNNIAIAATDINTYQRNAKGVRIINSTIHKVTIL